MTTALPDDVRHLSWAAAYLGIGQSTAYRLAKAGPTPRSIPKSETPSGASAMASLSPPLNNTSTAFIAIDGVNERQHLRIGQRFDRCR